MIERKPRRLKCRHCGKLVSRKSKNKYFCSVKCMKAAVKENNLPENKERIEAERDGLRFAKVAKKGRPLLPDEALAPGITFTEPAEYDSEKLNRTLLDEAGMYIDCSPDSSPLPANWSEMTQEQQIEWTLQQRGYFPDTLVKIGGEPYVIGENGIRYITPLTEADMVAYHNAQHPDSPIVTEELTLEKAREKYGDIIPSPWQGDAPEGTVAHKLKYGEFYKKDLK